MRDKTYRDNDLAFDYVANVLYPFDADDKRQALAEACMQALYLEGDVGNKATHIIAQLAIALMGSYWCQGWMIKNAPGWEDVELLSKNT